MENKTAARRAEAAEKRSSCQLQQVLDWSLPLVLEGPAPRRLLRYRSRRLEEPDTSARLSGKEKPLIKPELEEEKAKVSDMEEGFSAGCFSGGRLGGGARP